MEKLRNVSCDQTRKGNGFSERLINELTGITLTHLGGVGDDDVSLTGSCTRVRIKRKGEEDTNILIDLGSFVGGPNSHETQKRNKSFPFSPSDIDAVVVTHGHLDHIGKIPMLVNQEGQPFRGTIYATDVTSTLMRISLNDSVEIMEDEFSFQQDRADKLKKHLRSQLKELKVYERALNPARKSAKKNGIDRKAQEIRQTLTNTNEIKEKIEQIRAMLSDYGIEREADIEKIFAGRVEKAREKKLFDYADVEKALSLLRKTEFYETKEIAKGVYLTFFKAAHILGSAQVLLQIDKGDGSTYNMGFSGDVGRFFDPNELGVPDVIDKPLDFFQVESTYGDRIHKDKEKEISEMTNEINKITKRGGKILIPSFMIQRSQDMLSLLVKLKRYGKIPSNIQVYFDSENVEHLNNVYSVNNPEGYFDLKDPKIEKVSNHTKENEFLSCSGPAIMVCPSGMMSGGSVMKYLEYIINNPKHALFFVGFQAEGTLGRRIQEEDIVNIEIPRIGTVSKRCTIKSFSSFSSHGDVDDIMYLLNGMGFRPNGEVMVNHGESGGSQKQLVDTINKSFKDNGPTASPAIIGETKKLY
ncbi:MBL fold metallo-hydrolase [Candidatus Absconditicoccus praedator]|uniref:MBL fold metallo-hydrolase n=1 Tax=Candidatus Absconditicoccus praedator TaxID=2735562 RepID=UPI001E463ED5|nr:MBL fold metallo-hydrolase [Candidatus Absconditicoccus praedator]UFX82569.1 MBL fold metallo-hydrolase [Candidatus Absconditicoccus praedator]